MENITQKLEAAAIIINNMLGSHQGTSESAARYAVRQLDLPADVVTSLIAYANNQTGGKNDATGA